MSVSNESVKLRGWMDSPGEMSLEEREKLEDSRFFDSFGVNSWPLVILEKRDHLELCDPDRGFNKTSNPIIRSLANNQYGLSTAVYALIEHHHLETGQGTNENRKLAETIRNLGHKVDGKAVDLCAHIIPPSLGGKMEIENLFPLGRTDNWDQYANAERIIYNFIKKKHTQNGRAYLRLFLFYGDNYNPSCPTRFEYSYLLFSDESHRQQKSFSKVYFPVFVPNIGEIPISDLTLESAIAETPLDRESKLLIEEIGRVNDANENNEYWRKNVSRMEIIKSVALAGVVLYLCYAQFGQWYHKSTL